MENRFKDNLWFQALDDRQKNEVVLAVEYAERFNHGTDGHHRLLLIASLVDELVDYEARLHYHGEFKNE